MGAWKDKCERCGKDSLARICSFFNTQMICMACRKEEAAHPDYERARRTETEAVLRGDYNFPGIGLPPDLGRTE